MTLVVDVCADVDLALDVSTSRARLEAKEYHDYKQYESQMNIIILVYKMGISDIASPIPPLRNVIYVLQQDLWIWGQFVRRKLKYFSVLLSLGISII